LRMVFTGKGKRTKQLATGLMSYESEDGKRVYSLKKKKGADSAVAKKKAADSTVPVSTRAAAPAPQFDVVFVPVCVMRDQGKPQMTANGPFSDPCIAQGGFSTCALPAVPAFGPAVHPAWNGWNSVPDQRVFTGCGADAMLDEWNDMPSPHRAGLANGRREQSQCLRVEDYGMCGQGKLARFLEQPREDFAVKNGFISVDEQDVTQAPKRRASCPPDLLRIKHSEKKTKVILQNLPIRASKADVQSHLSSLGVPGSALSTLDLAVERRSGVTKPKNKGYAFLTFSKLQDAKRFMGKVEGTQLAGSSTVKRLHAAFKLGLGPLPHGKAEMLRGAEVFATGAAGAAAAA